MAEQTASGLWARILAIVASTLAAIAAGAGALVIGPALERIDTNTGLGSGMAVSLAIQSTQLARHKEEDEYWWGRVDENSAKIDSQGNGGAAHLRNLIDANERRIDAAEHGLVMANALESRVSALEGSMDAERIYYRRNVLPLMEAILRAQEQQGHEHGQSKK